MRKFKNKYRIKSSRYNGYDYAQNGYYFVTICTDEKQHFFGKIVNGGMVLNKIGEIVANEWQKTEIIRKNVFLDEWIVMPNHMHGILIIDNNILMSGSTPVDITTSGSTPVFGVETPWQGVSTVGVDMKCENITNVNKTTKKSRS